MDTVHDTDAGIVPSSVSQKNYRIGDGERRLDAFEGGDLFLKTNFCFMTSQTIVYTGESKTGAPKIAIQDFCADGKGDHRGFFGTF